MGMGIREAFAVKKQNARSEWHSGGSDHVTTDPDHAAARIYAGYADITPSYDGPKLSRKDAVFAMGSCFAREVEYSLSARGANVVSVDYKLIDRPEFRDAEGRIRDGFFHRFTPHAILHEFAIALGRPAGWDAENTLLVNSGSNVIDLNYWNVDGSDMSRASTLMRRQIARQLVRRVVNAKIVILTLGLTEGWIHRPTGFHINRFVPKLARHADDYEFENQGYTEVLKALEQVHRLLSHRSKREHFQIVVTVSPVPLLQTFTDKDIVIANMDSKATLRAAACAFTAKHENVHYFPSYEMVLYSNAKMAWRPDRIHVNRGMVNEIVSRFVDTYYEPDALSERKTNPPKLLEDVI